MAVIGELMADRAVGIDDVLFGAVDQVQDHRAALDMAEKAGAEPGALAGPFDQPRQVGDHKLGIVVKAHHAELRVQGRERVIGDFRAGMAHPRQKGRFAGVGQPDQPGIGDQLQPQPHP